MCFFFFLNQILRGPWHTKKIRNPPFRIVTVPLFHHDPIRQGKRLLHPICFNFMVELGWGSNGKAAENSVAIMKGHETLFLEKEIYTSDLAV